MPLPSLWIADQVRNDVTMRCIVFTLTLVLSHQGRGGIWLVLYCRHARPALWIPAYAGMTVRDAGMAVMDAGVTVRRASPPSLRAWSAMM